MLSLDSALRAALHTAVGYVTSISRNLTRTLGSALAFPVQKALSEADAIWDTRVVQEESAKNTE